MRIGSSLSPSAHGLGLGQRRPKYKERNSATRPPKFRLQRSVSAVRLFRKRGRTAKTEKFSFHFLKEKGARKIKKCGKIFPVLERKFFPEEFAGGDAECQTKSGFRFQKRFEHCQRLRTIQDFAIFGKMKSQCARRAPKRGAPGFPRRNQKAERNPRRQFFRKSGGSSLQSNNKTF